ncbi:MAG: DUF58 domain-containing protein [Pseudomonadota bacterium]
MNASPQNAAELRAGAEAVSSGLPALLARAEHLAATLALGAHGRKRAGQGEDFWQYRMAEYGDDLRRIDWRRSAKSDKLFIRQKEWQAAQSVYFWVDPGASMAFGDVPKSDRAQLLALAIAILLSKSGERFGLLDLPEPPKTGETQLGKMARAMMGRSAVQDYAKLVPVALPKGSRAVFLSDFLGDWDGLRDALSRVADQGVRGVLMQVLDPAEVAFPFKGRTIFESMQKSLSFEARRADALRQAYLDKLAQRSEALQALARKTGWRFTQHVTDKPAQSAVLWLYNALELG